MRPKLHAKIGIIAALIALAALVALTRHPTVPVEQVDSAPARLREIPLSILYSWLRMSAAYVASLVFAICWGTLAATSARRSKTLLPLIDILQSIPILGFFPTAIYWFAQFSSEQRVGLELAAIFLIFTSMSWNLVFAVYDAIKGIPSETTEAGRSLGLGPLAIFRRIYLPASLPRLVDNSLLSWSNGWYFLMACEIISMGPLSYRLPGVGAFISQSIEQKLWLHLGIAIAGLVLVIVAMDYLLWKPLSELAKIYTFESSTREQSGFKNKTLLGFYRNSQAFGPVRNFLSSVYKSWERLEAYFEKPTLHGYQSSRFWRSFMPALIIGFWILLLVAAGYAVFALTRAILQPWPLNPLVIFASVLSSGLRILGAYVFCALWILPLSYFIHRSPKLMLRLRSFCQVLASIPATAFFPLIIVAALGIFKTDEVACLLLLVTGMVWYLLFNVLGAAAAIPNDILEAADSLGVKRKLYFTKVFLPSILPALITGSITAAGGGWNALIISEYFKHDGIVHKVFGVGSLLAEATYESGNTNALALVLLIMVSFIVVLNRFFWQRLYLWSEKRFKLEG